MKIRILLYVASVLIIGWGGVFAALAFDQELVIISITMFAMAILSYPLGSIASVVVFSLVAIGFMTSAEALAIAVPAYAVLGYLQWYRLFPRLYGKRSDRA